MTTTINGTPVITATYTATTLSLYSNLRAPTAITTEFGMETNVVVYPGGLAWWLYGKAKLFHRCIDL
jgi:hypothetical protein